MGKSIFSISHGKTPCWFYVIYNSSDYFLSQDFCFSSYSELSESWRRGGARPRRGSRGELQGSLGFQENCHPRDCEQVEIGHKGTKEGVGYLPILFTAFRVIIRSAGCWGRTNILDKRRITRERKKSIRTSARSPNLGLAAKMLRLALTSIFSPQLDVRTDLGRV